MGIIEKYVSSFEGFTRVKLQLIAYTIWQAYESY
jgi:hypothetical protein